MQAGAVEAGDLEDPLVPAYAPQLPRKRRGRRGADVAIVLAAARHEHVVAVTDRGDGASGAHLLGQQLGEGVAHQAGAENVAHAALAQHGDVDRHDVPPRDGTEREIGDVRPSRLEHRTHVVEVGGLRQRRAERPQQREDLVARGVHEVDGEPARVDLARAARLLVERGEVAAVERGRRGQRAQDRDRRVELALDRHRDRARRLLQPALHRRLAIALDEDHHGHGQDQDRQCGGGDQEGEVGPKLHPGVTRVPREMLTCDLREGVTHE